MKGDKVITGVYIPAKHYLRLRQYCSAKASLSDDNRVTVSSIIRTAIAEYLENHKDEMRETVSKVFSNPDEFIGINLEE